MISKNLSIKLMRESVRRRIGIAVLINLIWFFSFVVPAMMMWGERGGQYDWKPYFTDLFADFVAPQNGWVIFCMIAMAMVCGLSSFRYLNSKSKVDFYHSLPIKRTTFFFSNFAAGIVMVIFPYLLFTAIFVLIGLLGGCDFNSLVGNWMLGFAVHAIYYFLVYATVVFAGMLTGNLIIGFLGSVTFFFYIPAIIGIILVYCDLYLDTFVGGMTGLIEHIMVRTSPVISYFWYGLEGIEDLKRPWTILAGALILALVLTLLSRLLYQKRPSEGAGKALVFSISRPVIRILIVVLFSLLMALAFGEVRSSMVWCVFGLLCGGVVTHCMMEAIYHFDIRKMFSHWKQWAVCTMFSLLVICAFRYDLIGYDSFLPKPGQVQSAVIYLNSLDSWVDYGRVEFNGMEYEWEEEYGQDYIFENMELSDVSPVVEIARIGIQQNSSEDREEKYYERQNVTIQYHMKSGRKVKRRYLIPNELIRDQLKQISTDSDYLAGKYPLLKLDLASLSAVIYREGTEIFEPASLTVGQVQEFYRIYTDEFINGVLTEQLDSVPIGTVRFVTAEQAQALQYNAELEKQNGPDYYYGDYLKRREYYPIYPSFTKTIAYLKTIGVPAGELWLSFPVTEIQFNSYQYYYDEKTESQRPIVWSVNAITDQKDIQDVMKNSVPYDHLRYIGYNLKEDMIEFSISYGMGMTDYQASRVIPREYLEKWIIKGE